MPCWVVRTVSASMDEVAVAMQTCSETDNKENNTSRVVFTYCLWRQTSTGAFSGGTKIRSYCGINIFPAAVLYKPQCLPSYNVLKQRNKLRRASTHLPYTFYFQPPTSYLLQPAFLLLVPILYCTRLDLHRVTRYANDSRVWPDLPANRPVGSWEHSGSGPTL